jgi:predicted deacetylase
LIPAPAQSLPRPAQYLLRIDDLCPRVARDRWQALRALIQDFNLKPILAVVPENRDPGLDASPPDPEFWRDLSVLQNSGAAIGLHGYRHLCASRGRSLLGLESLSEFAGVAPGLQREWIAAGLRILRGHGLNPRIFVAPRHGFDASTLIALRAQGVPLLSDGFARAPFLRSGITWIPHQLWAPIDKAQGLWTICVHPNTASDAELDRLRAFLRDRAGQFTSVDHVVAKFPAAALEVGEKFYACVGLWRVKLRRFPRAVLRSSRSSYNSSH